MPRFDGTGPSGTGPLTGRGLGPCGAGDHYGRSNIMRYWFSGKFFGRMRGFGFRNFSDWSGRKFFQNFEKTQTDPETEASFIRQETEFLKEKLGLMQNRLEQLEKEKTD